jgi:L-arabinose isomerase
LEQVAKLQDCDAERLYYGLDGPANPLEARLCALSPGNEDSAQEAGILMMLYANGVGVTRDFSLAKKAACGAVGEAVADLERAGKRHAVITGVVEGGDPEVAAQIEDWCKAAQVRRRFRQTNIAQIGRPYPGMMDLYIDETNLYNRMGLYTKQFDWEDMWAIADDITDTEAIKAKAQDIIDTFVLKTIKRFEPTQNNGTR